MTLGLIYTNQPFFILEIHNQHQLAKTIDLQTKLDYAIYS